MNPYFRTPPVVKNLLIINILVFMATSLLSKAPAGHMLLGHQLETMGGVGDYIQAYGTLYWFESPFFHPWQFVSYMFLHGGFEHLFFNMFALWMFGRVIEEDLGSKRFLIYYFACGIGAALIQLATVWFTGEFEIGLVGASGAVMGLLLAFGVLHPNATIMLLLPPIPIKAKWFVVIYGALELLLGTTGYGGQIAHFAHVGGMLWGVLLLFAWRRSGKIRF